MTLSATRHGAPCGHASDGHPGAAGCAANHGAGARFLLGCTLALLVGCGAEGPSGRFDETTTHPDAPPIAPFDACTVYTAREEVTSFQHTFVCAELDLTTSPPVGGDHYPIWAAYQSYEAPVPWGFLLHSMEHGAVVVTYRCDDASCALSEALQAVLDERPDDPRCTGQATRNRMILVPDPELDEPIAAVAWGRMYSATCLDAPSLHAFIDGAYGRAREDLCNAGMDGSASGWCAAP